MLQSNSIPIALVNSPRGSANIFIYKQKFFLIFLHELIFVWGLFRHKRTKWYSFSSIPCKMNEKKFHINIKLFIKMDHEWKVTKLLQNLILFTSMIANGFGCTYWCYFRTKRRTKILFCASEIKLCHLNLSKNKSNTFSALLIYIMLSRQIHQKNWFMIIKKNIYKIKSQKQKLHTFPSAFVFWDQAAITNGSFTDTHAIKSYPAFCKVDNFSSFIVSISN